MPRELRAHSMQDSVQADAYSTLRRNCREMGDLPVASQLTRCLANSVPLFLAAASKTAQSITASLQNTSGKPDACRLRTGRAAPVASEDHASY
jgi:hypothetical protein